MLTFTSQKKVGLLFTWKINNLIKFSLKDDTVFQIETAYPRNGEKIILRTHSSTERNQWISTLTHVKNDYIKILEHGK